MYKNLNIVELYEGLLKSGLRFERYKNSKFISKSKTNSKYKTGKIAGAFSKDALIQGDYTIFGSIESLVDSHKGLTHFTPNVYKTLARSKEGKVFGHSEENLKQINTFVVDFDGVDKNVITITDIVLRGKEANLIPTTILDTPKGYQAYFNLSNPVFVKKGESHKLSGSVTIAKRISQNIREFFNKGIPGVDFSCNHFGFFRCPTEDNILYHNEKYVYEFADLITFSKDFEGVDILKTVEKDKNVKVIKRLKNIHELWFHKLYACRHIEGSGGNIGRDNAIFTMALHMFSCNTPISNTIDMMRKFNEKLYKPLNDSVVLQKVKSAYTGNYKGATKFYITELVYTWCELTNDEKNKLFFRNHAKKREDRVRSHYDERIKDLLTFIGENAQNGSLKTTGTALREAINMPKSTLYDVLNSTDMFIWNATKGRYASIKITTKSIFFKYVKQQMKHVRELRITFRRVLTELVGEVSHTQTERLLEVYQQFENIMSNNEKLTRIVENIS
ncbi:primase C-terminal domain-containing protein [Macrococcus animalis]|uniref:primase C-terminal domain-containing protein n=1 Tax=Macrococcus animalis TaxID=3395467 RepID=UPI0039BE9F4D